MKLFGIAGALLAMTAASPALAAERPIEVMVLGTWHFANNNRDLHNVKSDDVRTPQRQAELQALADALARFRPTRIMIEKVANTPGLIDADFADFTPAMLAEERNERIQIGYRLGHQLKLGRLYAIDEQPADGEPDYFPYGKVAEYAETHGKTGELERIHAREEARVKELGEKQARMSIPALLAEINAPERGAENISPYYEILKVGDADRQPGAELNAMWYMRNAKIFAKLATLAEPGDRVLVIYGVGHAYWLRHFASETPGFRNVDAVPYLESAAAGGKRKAR